jgi:hypothetical protein
MYEQFSVAYCNAYYSDQTNTKILEISTKINVYSYGRATDLHFVVVGLSVGVLRQ